MLPELGETVASASTIEVIFREPFCSTLLQCAFYFAILAYVSVVFKFTVSDSGDSF